MSETRSEDASLERQALLECAQQWATSLELTGLHPESNRAPKGRSAELLLRGSPGHVLRVQACDTTVHRAAMNLTHLDEGDVSEALLEDMLGEIANTVGGNLYPVLSGATGLGLPEREVLGGLELARVCLGDGKGGGVWLQLRRLDRPA